MDMAGNFVESRFAIDRRTVSGGGAVKCRSSALADQDADLDLQHVQPAGVLGNVVEFQSAQHPSGFVGREGLIERAGRMRRQIVQH
jgi:hypothetical protein